MASVLHYMRLVAGSLGKKHQILGVGVYLYRLRQFTIITDRFLHLINMKES
jgi:hypothetical protein